MFTFDIGPLGYAILVVGSVLIGIALRRQVSRPWEWIVTAIGTFLGAFLTSEWVVTSGIVAFDVDGVAIIAALAGGLFIGTAVALGIEWYVRHFGGSAGPSDLAGGGSGTLRHLPR
jgi:hypothetical protein